MCRGKFERMYKRSARFETLESRLFLSVLLDSDLAPAPITNPEPDPSYIEVNPMDGGEAAVTMLLSDYGNLSDALAAIGGDFANLCIDTHYVLDADVNVPANVHLSVIEGGSLACGSWQIIINGEFDSVASGLVEGPGYFIFKTGSVTSLRARWWYGSDTDIIVESLRSASVSDVKHVLFEGEFIVEHDILINSSAYSNITLSGEGESTVFRLSPSTYGALMFRVDARESRIDNLTFENFVMDGQDGTLGSGIYSFHGHNPFGVHGMIVRSITARNFEKTGFYLGGNVVGTQLVAENNEVHGFVARDGRIILDQIQTRGNGIQGIDIAGGKDGFVTNATLKNFVIENNPWSSKIALGENGQQIHASFSDGIIQNNGSSGFYVSYVEGRITDFSGISTSWNNVQAIGNDGIGLDLRVGAAELHNIIANNNSLHGINAAGASVVGDCITASGNGYYGIAAENCQFSNLEITNNQNYGIRIRGNCTLTDGIIANNKYYGIKTSNANAVLQFIEVLSGSEPQQYGIAAREGSSVLLTGMPGTHWTVDATSTVTEDVQIMHHAILDDNGTGQSGIFGQLEYPSASVEARSDDFGLPNYELVQSDYLIEEAPPSSLKFPDLAETQDTEIDAFWDSLGEMENDDVLRSALEDGSESTGDNLESDLLTSLLPSDE